MESLPALLVDTLKLSSKVAKETLAKVVGNRVKLLRFLPQFLVELQLVMGLQIVLLLPPDFLIKNYTIITIDKTYLSRGCCSA